MRVVLGLHIGVALLAISLCDLANARTLVVNGAAPGASDENPGTSDAPLKTISRGAELAEAGDTVLVLPGVYREHVSPARGGEAGKPIRYVSAERHGAIVRGSEVVSGPWREGGAPNCFATELDPEWFSGYNPFSIARATKFPDFTAWSAAHNLGQVFVDGAPFTQTLSMGELGKRPGSWFKPADAMTLYVHFATDRTPAEVRVEVTVRERLFAPHARGLGYIQVEGFVFEHAANQFPSNFWNTPANAQAGAVGCGSGHHWTIRDNIIRDANSIGLDCGSETNGELRGQPKPPANQVGHHLIANNVIEDNGACGIAGWEHTGTQVTGNIIQRNNRLGIMAWETAGIKFHGFRDGVIQDNFIRDNDAWGIWLDNVYRGSRVDANLIIGNLWGGVFLELGDGPLKVVNNVIAYSVSGNEVHHRGGHGVYGHDASGVLVAHNLLYANAGFGVTSRVVSDRTMKGRLVEASRWVVEHNQFIGNKTGELAFTVPCARARGNTSDRNLFMPAATIGTSQPFALNSLITPSTRQAEEEMAASLMRGGHENSPDYGETPEVYVDEDVIDLLPWLGSAQWAKHLQWDVKSVFLPPNSTMTLRREVLEWHTAVEGEHDAVRLERTSDVEKDYFGSPRAGAMVHPGPFGAVAGDYYPVSLWPKTRGEGGES